MCGIAGLVARGGSLEPWELPLIAEAMGRAIAHRGPDAAGVWTDDRRVAFSHQRLSIIDLSTVANQPMVSACGRWVLAYNGECYNFEELRHRLDAEKSIPWRSRSDTEVVLEAIAAWGVSAALVEFNGMFAFSAFDRHEKRLYLARDRLGKKPLFFALTDRALLFGSELKALMACDFFPRAVDPGAVGEYLRYGYVPGARAIFASTEKVPAGSYVAVDIADDSNLQIAERRTYWSAAARFLETQVNGQASKPQAKLDELLRDSVKKRLIADVPVGCLLSGGVDSSLITALAVQTNPTGHKIRTFTVGFRESQYDESIYARQIADHLGTEHTELQLTHDTAIDEVQNLPKIYDEPFADPSQLPTFLVARSASEHVKVVLSGDGGDEAFLGYTRYARKLEQWRRVKNLPLPIRTLAGALAMGIGRSLGGGGTGGLLGARNSESLQRAGRLLGSRSAAEAYWHGISLWHSPEALLLPGVPRPSMPDLFSPRPTDELKNFSLIDELTYLPDDILCKVDRASMAVALEARGPLLDYRVIEAAWRLPTDQLQRQGEGKQPLRTLVYEMIPRALIDRPKQGFGVPLEHWLRGPLRAWAESIVLESSPMPNILDERRVARVWNAFCRGADELADVAWAILCLKMWAVEYRVDA